MLSGETLSNYDIILVKMYGTILGKQLSTSTSKTYKWKAALGATVSSSSDFPKDISGSGNGETAIHIVKTYHRFTPIGWWGQMNRDSSGYRGTITESPLLMSVYSESYEQISTELHVTVYGMTL